MVKITEKAFYENHELSAFIPWEIWSTVFNFRLEDNEYLPLADSLFDALALNTHQCERPLISLLYIILRYHHEINEDSVNAIRESFKDPAYICTAAAIAENVVLLQACIENDYQHYKNNIILLTISALEWAVRLRKALAIKLLLNAMSLNQRVSVLVSCKNPLFFWAVSHDDVAMFDILFVYLPPEHQSTLLAFDDYELFAKSVKRNSFDVVKRLVECVSADELNKMLTSNGTFKAYQQALATQNVTMIDYLHSFDVLQMHAASLNPPPVPYTQTPIVLFAPDPFGAKSKNEKQLEEKKKPKKKKHRRCEIL